MNILQLTPGAGPMICGNCLRDNALVAALRALGHEVTLVPLYLPLTLDEKDESNGMPIFFSGINVFLEQKSAFFRTAPAWLHHLLASRWLLKWAAGRAAKTRAAELGELTLSMLRGEAGHQARELDELLQWLKTQPRPDVVFLSNALLLGLARRLRSDLGAPVVCMLQGEDTYLDALPESHRATCWRTLAERAAEVSLLTAPSHYFGELMQNRLGVSPERVQVVYNGINLGGYEANPAAAGFQPAREAAALPAGAEETQARPSPAGWEPAARPGPVLGFFARMCREKGLDTLVEAFIALRRGQRVPGLRLRVGGACGPMDEPLVRSLQQRLRAEGLQADVEFCPNLDHADKLAFLKSLSVFSVPAMYGEAFGLYLLEALAAGVPVVQPRTAAFPELVAATGGGVVYTPGSPQALADALEPLLLDPPGARALGRAGQRAVFEQFSAEAMARGTVALAERVLGRREIQARENAEAAK